MSQKNLTKREIKMGPIAISALLIIFFCVQLALYPNYFNLEKYYRIYSFDVYLTSILVSLNFLIYFIVKSFPNKITRMVGFILFFVICGIGILAGVLGYWGADFSYNHDTVAFLKLSIVKTSCVQILFEILILYLWIKELLHGK